MVVGVRTAQGKKERTRNHISLLREGRRCVFGVNGVRWAGAGDRAYRYAVVTDEHALDSTAAAIRFDEFRRSADNRLGI